MVAAAAITLNEGKTIDEVAAAVVAAGGTDTEARAAAQEAVNVAAKATAATAGAAAATAGTGATATGAVTRTATRAVANVVFALTPASSVQGIIDFNTKIGAQIYAIGTKSLDPQELYDCMPEYMYPFLKMLSERANKMGWNDSTYGIVHIPKQGQVYAVDPAKDCLLTNYGEISMDRIVNFEKSYINKSTRAAQDGYMMFRCIWNSLSRTGRNKVQICLLYTSPSPRD